MGPTGSGMSTVGSSHKCFPAYCFQSAALRDSREWERRTQHYSHTAVGSEIDCRDFTKIVLVGM